MVEQLKQGNHNHSIVEQFCQHLPPVIADKLIELHLEFYAKNSWADDEYVRSLEQALHYGIEYSDGSVFYKVWYCMPRHSSHIDFKHLLDIATEFSLDVDRINEAPIPLVDRLAALEPAEDRGTPDEQPDLAVTETPQTIEPPHIEGLWKLYESLASQNTSAFDAIMHNNGDGTVRMYRREEFIYLVKTQPTFLVMFQILVAEADMNDVKCEISRLDIYNASRHEALKKDLQAKVNLLHDSDINRSGEVKKAIEDATLKVQGFVDSAAKWTHNKVNADIQPLLSVVRLNKREKIVSTISIIVGMIIIGRFMYSVFF